MEEGARQGKGWLDPGGLTTDLVRGWRQGCRAAARAGEVIERDATHVVVLGAESEALGVQLKKGPAAGWGRGARVVHRDGAEHAGGGAECVPAECGAAGRGGDGADARRRAARLRR